METKQAIAGEMPAQQGEATIMNVWPSMAATGVGRFLGRLYVNKTGIGAVLTLGNLIALASIPLALLIYFWNFAPWRCRRYRLTNRRVIIEKGLIGGVIRSVGLDEFDSIEIQHLPGQAWFAAGDMIFRRGEVETFRLHGVVSPESFRQTCLKAHLSYVGVRQAMQR